MPTRTVDQHIGDKIRVRRTELGLTQEQLAAALEISYQQIQKYESGSNRISAARLFGLARRMDVPIAYFFDGLVDGDGVAPTSPNIGRQRTTIDVMRSFAEIVDNEVRVSIAGLLRTVADRQA
jgi:transcriptional regulator with XRE-family HTH domain